MSFGKRTAAAPNASLRRTPKSAARGWWRAYLFSLLACELGNLLMAGGLALFAGAKIDAAYAGYVLGGAALATFGLMTIQTPVIGVVGGLLHRLGVVSTPLYVVAVSTSVLAAGRLASGIAPDGFELTAVALMTPGALLGGLALGWGLRAKA